MSDGRLGHRLYKREKLCSPTAIDSLFARDAKAPGLSASLAFPFRAVWRWVPDDGEEKARVAPVPQFLVSVPKKRLRHAVDRARIRRLAREAWRLQRDMLPERGRLQIAFVYVATTLQPYAVVARSLRKLFKRIVQTAPVASEEPSAPYASSPGE